MNPTTFQSSEPVLSPENMSVEKKKIADIQIIGGAQYFKRPPVADCSGSPSTFSIIPFAHEIVSLAHSAAPISPALLPNCAWTTSTWSESTRKTRDRIEDQFAGGRHAAADHDPSRSHGSNHIGDARADDLAGEFVNLARGRVAA